MYAKFGTAGSCKDFYENGGKSALDMPLWLREKGLECFEYQCGRGVKISEDAARKLGEKATENGIILSIHAPYYISLSSTEPEKRDNSIRYIMDSLKAAKNMGAGRIVVHSGSCGSITRKEALELATDTLKRAVAAADEAGYGDIHICPETMGKVKQLGNVDEVIKLCLIDERIIPTIDFGHVNAMTLGGLKTVEDVEEILIKLENKLGAERGKNFHAHYSRIEYTNAGEKKHHTFAESEFEPDFSHIAEALARRGATPHIICESAGTQTRDAAEIKRIYLDAGK